ncbi:hypothetical protein VTK26DRAFT_4286 [Humicola hyalothermophila]
MPSAGLIRDDEEEARRSGADKTGLRGVSTLPSMLRASSRLARLCIELRSPGTTLSKLAFPERFGLGTISVGLLMLLRGPVRPGRSSTRVAAPLEVSESIRPCTVTGATAAFAVEGVGAFPTFCRLWLLVDGVLTADAVVMEDALEDWGAYDWESPVMTPADDKPEVGASEDVAVSAVTFVLPLSPLGRGEVPGPKGAVLVLFLDRFSWPSASSLSCVEPLPPTPTASLKRLYKPLSPCWTNSPAVALVSEAGSELGGGAKSLKVVRASDWLAVEWILSRSRVSCSLSICEDLDIDIVEPRRGRSPIGDGGTDGPREGCEGCFAPLELAIGPDWCRSDARRYATRTFRRIKSHALMAGALQSGRASVSGATS